MDENHFFDMDGNPIDVLEWGRLFEDRAGCTLARDEVGDRIIITVWFGHDEDHWVGDHEGTPRIFGTAVFAGTASLIHEVRTTTHIDALDTHRLVLESQRNQYLNRQRERVDHGYDEH